MSTNILPSTVAEQNRWKETRKRRRIQDEQLDADVTERLSQRMTPGRTINLGKPVTSLNLAQSAVSQIAVQYDAPPTVSNPALEDPATQAVWSLVQEDTHIWELAQSNAESVIGLRENLVRINRTPNGVRLSLVYPDTVEIETAPGDIDRIVLIKEAGIYTHNKEEKECWTIWDIRDPANPKYSIVTVDDGTEITSSADPEYDGWHFVFEDGTAFLPFVRYRARFSPKLWDAFYWSTLFESAIDCAILWTCWHKWVQDASWAQRYVIDLVLQGLTVTGSGATATASVEADPASILCFKTVGDKTGTASQFQPPGNPKELAESIMVFQASVLSNIGIHPTDIEASASPASGVAISLKRSAQRRMAKKYIPQFRAGDTELLKKIAATHNSLAVEGSPALPEDGWSLEYHLPEQSADEIVGDLEFDLKLVAEGLMSKVDVFMKLHPDLDRVTALARLKQIIAEGKALADSEKGLTNDADNAVAA